MTAISYKPYESETQPAHNPGMLEPAYNEPISDDSDNEDDPDTEELPLDDEEDQPLTDEGIEPQD